MKNIQSIIMALFFTSVVAFFVFGNQYLRVNLTQYEEMTDVLAQLKSQDVRMNEHMLLTGNGALVNFDMVVQISKNLSRLEQRLMQLENNMSENDRQVVEAISDQLFSELKKKRRNIEQYKSEHSILRNSQTFIPNEIAHLAPLLWIETQAKLYGLNADVAVYIASPSERLQQHIMTMVNTLKDDESIPDSDILLENVFKHVEVVVNTAMALHKLSREVLHQPTLQLIESIELQQQLNHAKAVRYNDNFIFIMSGLALLGLFVIILVVQRLRLVAAKMKESVTELEHMKFALDQHSIVGITDRTGRITYANDKFCEISQYRREELIGQDHRILNSGSHPKIFFFNMWKSIAKGETWHGEIQNKCKDGSMYWVETSIVPFLGKEGKVERYIAIRTDITSRKEEEVRSASLARFPAENPYPVMRLDYRGTIIYANHASHIILDALHLRVGDLLPTNMQQDCKAVFSDKSSLTTELILGDIAIHELKYRLLFCRTTSIASPIFSY